MDKKVLKLFIGVFLLSLFCRTGLSLPFSYAQKSPAEEEPKLLELDGTEWEVALTCEAGKGWGKPKDDKLIFEEGKFSSESFQDEYKPTNYTLSEEEEKTVFETMQTKEDEKIFWRGEVQDKKIRGVTSIHPEEGESKTCMFNGDLSEGKLKYKEKTRKKGAPEILQKKEKVTQDEAGKTQDKEGEEPVETEAEKSFWEKLFENN